MIFSHRQKIHLQVLKNELNWSYAKIIFPASFADQGVLNKGPTVWLDGARSPQNTFASI
jgi:hypothetical protein